MIFIGLAVPVAGIAGYFWLSGSVPDLDRTVAVDGLSAPVQVVHDPHGVPHIYAADMHDAYFALGYVHARDRMWQMDARRRLATGHLAEIAGDPALGIDRLMRTLGMAQLAEASYATLPPEVQQALDAYSNGVNAWLANREGPLPPSFFLLGYEPAPWTPADTLALERLLALQLSGNYRDELLRARLIALLGEAQAADLFPEGADVLVSIDHAALDGLYQRTLAGLEAVPSATGASNVWALSGARTQTGAPLLANDPHLGLTIPIQWYLAHIETPELTVTGATMPGAPFTILGHNRSLAWGQTTTGADVEDLFLERIDPDDPDRYLTPDGSAAFATRTETIVVDGEPEPLTMTVRTTRHGPVVSDLEQPEIDAVRADDTVVALAFTGLDQESVVATALYRLNRAETVSQAIDALADWRAPAQNIALADADGAIALTTPGRFPLRRSGDGLLPVPGWSGDYDWEGYAAYADLPRTIDPPSGQVLNANNPVVGRDYPVLITGYPYEPDYRARRIAELLDDPASGTVAGAEAMMLDTVSPAAADLLPLLLDTEATDAAAADALALLRDWDFRMDRDRPEPLIFTAWLRQLNRHLYADELAELFVDYWHLRPRTVRHMLTEAQQWCDVLATEAVETCADITRDALAEAIAELAERYGDDPTDWRWGDAHVAVFPHQVVSLMPLVGSFFTNSVEADGGNFTLNRGATPIVSAERAFQDVHGAGYRAVYDLADLGRSQFMIATGQSGNPLSPYFDDLIEPWRDGEWLTLGAPPEELQQTSVGTLTLRPES
ncbi:MAG: penicillin acylase family protein [Rhodospirillaceae bacterium]|nr:penicillin acylase family protein [Rhodospirillaceae bacterium]